MKQVTPGYRKIYRIAGLKYTIVHISCLILYIYRGDSWLSYDNERYIALKSQFAYDQGLAGVMTWSIDTNDFHINIFNFGIKYLGFLDCSKKLLY